MQEESFIKKHSGLFTSNKQDWTTPKDLFETLNKQFEFTLDACASKENALCKKYYTEEDSCLFHSWENEHVFINPPYKNIYRFIEKCDLEAQNYNTKICLLVPARTDTSWFHKFIYMKKNVEVQFIKGRLKFGNSKQSAPFPSMLVFFNLNVGYCYGN